jgi:RimJ/RimL family protein N-acetyltransferase
MDPKPITLSGRHVRLEPITQAHASDLLAALTVDPTIWRWMPQAPPVTPAAMARMIQEDLADLAKGERIIFAQIDLKSGQAVGRTTYMDIRRRDRGVEIGGTWIGKPWQRSGINTEAKYLLIRHAFEDLHAVRVMLKTDGRNLQSQAAIERIGAQKEGVLRRNMMLHDGFIRDTVMFSILEDEWPAAKARLEEMMKKYPRINTN